MSKLLTVVVSIYNVEQYLHKCLDSLVVPEYLDQLEVLAIVDGSPDSSIEIARQFEQKYPQTFRVIEKENGGHGSCLNLGLQEAQGKYWCVLDSDDWFDKENFPIFLSRLSRSSADVVWTNYVSEMIKGKDKLVSKFNRYVQRFGGEGVREIKDVDLTKDSTPFFILHRCAYNTELLRASQIVFLEKKPYDDVALFFFPFKTMRTVEFIDLDLYHYLLGREGQTVTGITQAKLDALIEVNKFYIEEFVRNMNSYPDYAQVYLKWIICKVMTAVTRGYAKSISTKVFVEYFIKWFDYLSTIPELDIQSHKRYKKYLLYKRLPIGPLSAVLDFVYTILLRKKKI